MNLTLAGTLLTAAYTMREIKTYTLKNRGSHDRTMLIEHPIRAGAYKDILKKFVAQEERIEESQRNVRTLEAQVQRQQKDYDAFVNGLTVQ